MPQYVDFHEPYGIQEFPDGITDEQIWSKYDELEAGRTRQLGRARLDLEGAKTAVEQDQPSLGKYLTRAGLALREGAAGVTQQAVGNIARTYAEVMGPPPPDEPRIGPRSVLRAALTPTVAGAYLRATSSREPAAPVNILREAGRSVAEAGDLQLREAAEMGRTIGGGVGPAITESLAGTAGASAPPLLTFPFGLPALAGAAGAQAYGSNLSQFRDILRARNPELTEQEAYDRAQTPAAITALVTTALTRSFGGVERFLTKITAEGIGTGGVKGLLRQAFKSASLELPEEYLDQLDQGFVEKAFVNPDKPISEIFNQAGLAGLYGFALGGLTTGVVGGPLLAAQAVSRARDRSNLRRGEVRRRAVIREGIDSGELIPETKGTYADQSRTSPVAPSQQAPGVVQEAEEPVRLRGAQETPRVEAEAAPVTPPTINSRDIDTSLIVPEASPASTGKIPLQNTRWAESVPVTAESSPSPPVAQIQPPAATQVAAEESRVTALPANPIGEQAVRARLTELGAQPESMISVVNDPTDLVDARIGFSEEGEPQWITINVAAIGSPEQVDRAIEHEATHVVERAGGATQILSELTDTERAAISADMDRLGYATASKAEFDTRGVDVLAQAWKGRNWFEKAVSYVADLAARLRFPMTRLAAERAAARLVGRAIKQSLTSAAGTEPVTQTFESRTPTTFETRSQVDLAVSDPLLKPAQIQVARDLAAVQSSLVNQETVDWLDAAPVSKADGRAKPWLRYLKDRFEMSDMQALLRSMPETTDEQKQAKEVAGGAILNHYGTDRAVEAERLRDLEAKFVRRAEVGKRVAKMDVAKLKANFLEALFNRFTSDYRQYIVDQIAAAPASANIDSQFRQNLGVAERRLNDQQHSPGALQAALSAIATNIPTNLLTPGTTNQQIVDWAVQSGILVNVVGQDVRQWITVDAGNGVPALIGYARLLPDLINLRELLLKREQVKRDLTDFEQWFSPTGKATKATPKQLAERYFKARTGRDKALAIAQAIEKEIDDLDTDILANQIALERLRALMTSPTYVSTVREAANKAHVVVRALYDSQGIRTGLLHRGGEEQGLSAGLLRGVGPMKGTEYLVNLDPSTAQEFENVVKLKAFAREARDYHAANATSDPLLADSYLSLANEIDQFYVHPALNPGTGFTQRPWLQIPGTQIRFGMDPSGILPKTLRSVLEKIGGRTAVQAVRDMNELDSVMKQVDGINAHKEYGYAKQTEAIRKALKSHGWSPDQFPRWDELIAERVYAAGQSALSPAYEVGDVVVGSGGVKVTAEDLAALRMAKKWEDAILRVAPRLILDRLADLGIIRKAVGSGKFTMARVQAPWVKGFLSQWDEKASSDDRWNLLRNDILFRRVVLGYVFEFNPEFARMNAASPKATPFFRTFRKMAQLEKAGIQFFNSTNDVLDFIANEMVTAGTAPDYPTALENARENLMGDITAFVQSFKDNVVGRKQDSVWGAVPDGVVKAATANNAFTMPRGELAAPSTFYSYSTGSDGSRFTHVGSLRSLLNLQVIQSLREAFEAMTSTKNKLHDRIAELETAGRSHGVAMKEMVDETQRSRKLNEIRYDYYELLDALGMMESVFSEMERFEASTAEHYQSQGVAALMNAFGTLKSFLLSSTQAITTNTFSGAMLGPAVIHLQTGRIGKAMVDFVWEPHMWGTMYRRMSEAVASNPIMAKLLKQHAPVWSWMARQVVDAAEDWRKIQQIAESSGMVAPYNLAAVLANKRALKRTGGRLESQEKMNEINRALAGWNTFVSTPGPAHVAEVTRAFTPRLFDNFINYAQIVAFEYETDYLKKVGWAAFKAREAQAAKTGNNWKDLSDPANILQPADLRLKTHKALNRYRQLFSGLGSLDKVLLDFYERTKGMTKEQRAEEDLIPDLADHSSIAIQYATTNISTESNRPPLFKGKDKGKEGVLRNIAGTFMGWPINMAKMMGTMLESHSKDPQFYRIAHGIIALGVMVLLFAVGGAWNWEFGDELSKLFYNVSSARIQPGNVLNAAEQGDLMTAAAYFMQGLVNTVPYVGPMFGSLAGVAFTGRGNPFDVSSWNPIAGWVLDTWNTTKRSIQTGDVTLPLLSYVSRWMPLSKIGINRLPMMQGLVDQQNAVRSMLGSAPRGVEIKWGRGGGSAAVRYGKQNDEIMKLIASAYEAVAHGGSEAEVYKRRQLAIDAYVKEGKSEEEAAKSVNAALASKEPIRVLTGKEFASAEEEAKWVARMTPSQKADYDRAVQAWNLLGSVTGRNMSFVAGEGGGGGGGRRSIPGLASALPSGISIPSGLPSARSGLRLPSIGVTAGPSLASYTPRGLGGVRSIRRTRRTGSRRGLSSLRRRASRIRQPRLASSRRRSTRRRARSVYA